MKRNRRSLFASLRCVRIWDLRAATVVSCGRRISRLKSGRELLNRIVRCRGGGALYDSERGDDGRAGGWSGTARFNGLLGAFEEDLEEDTDEDMIAIRRLWMLMPFAWMPVVVWTRIG
jgi:hypothetical protein